MNALQFFHNLWRIGNFWLRLTLVVGVSGLLLIGATAAIGLPTLTAVAALFWVVIIALMALISPGVLVAVSTVPGGRKALAAAAAFTGFALAASVYFAVVPVGSDRELVPVAITAMLAIGVLRISGFGTGRTVAAALVLTLVALTVVWFLGGRERVGEWAHGLSFGPPSAGPTAPQPQKAEHPQAFVPVASLPGASQIAPAPPPPPRTMPNPWKTE